MTEGGEGQSEVLGRPRTAADSQNPYTRRASSLGDTGHGRSHQQRAGHNRTITDEPPQVIDSNLPQTRFGYNGVDAREAQRASRKFRGEDGSNGQ
jgi:hypothetical protein